MIHNTLRACLLCLVLMEVLLWSNESDAKHSSVAEQLIQRWKSAGHEEETAEALALSRLYNPFDKGQGRVLDVVYSLDARYLPALKTSLGSVLRSPTNSTNRFRVFVLIEHSDSNMQSGSATVIAAVGEWIREAGGSQVDHYLWVSELRSLDDNEIDCRPPSVLDHRGRGLNVILYVAGGEQRETLKLLEQLPGGQKETELVVMANIIRNWVHRFLLPFGVQRALYLDVDALVAADLQLLFDTPLSELDVVAVARRAERAGGSHFNYSHPLVQQSGLTPRNRFNAGVVLFNLQAYCQARVTDRNIQILRQQIASQDLWLPGRSTHQTPFILAVGSHRRFVASSWNLCSSTAKIIHCPSAFRSVVLDFVSPIDPSESPDDLIEH